MGGCMQTVIYGSTFQIAKDKLQNMVHNGELDLTGDVSGYSSKDSYKLEFSTGNTILAIRCTENCKAIKWDKVYVDSAIDKDLFYNVIYYNGVKGCADVVFY